MPPPGPHVNDQSVNMDCMADAFGRRPMGCVDDGWSWPSPYASLAQNNRAFGDDSGVHDTGDCDQSTPWGCPYGGELHKKGRAFGDDSGVHDTGDCDQSTPWGCPYGGELHKKGRAFGDDSGVHDTGDCD